MDTNHEGEHSEEEEMDPQQHKKHSGEKKTKKFREITSHSLEHTSEGKRLRKQGVVTCISTGCLSGTDSGDTMPKISVAMRSLNRSIHQLFKEDLEIRPGYRPPTPARQSLPNLLPASTRQGSEGPASRTGDLWRSSNGEVRRITLAGQQRSTTPTSFLQQQQRALAVADVDLNASTRSEGWMHNGGSGGGSGGVVHLPPITKRRQDEKQDNRLTVAKKTLEQLDNVLSSDDSLVYRHSLSSPPVHTHT